MKRSMSLIIVLLLLASLSYAVINYLDNRHFISTDNAYTTGDIITVSAQVDDMVKWLGGEEGDYIEAGQALIKLDDGDSRNLLSRSKSSLARAVQDVASLKQKVKRRQATVTQWQASYKLAHNEAQRRRKLVAKGMVSEEEYDVAVLKKAEIAAALDTARQHLGEAQLNAGTMSIAEHPEVTRAAAYVRGAKSNLNKTTIVSPVNGHIAKRFVSPGDIVKAGRPLFQIVQLHKVWIEANLKETKLRKLRIGQPVTIVSDFYGEETVYQGEVLSSGTGTGAAFSLLPAQNATGNWLKIVQRVPVRIAFTDETILKKPLAIGTSLTISIDTSDQSGLQLANAPAAKPIDVSAVYRYWDDDTFEMADRIIAQHLPNSPANDFSTQGKNQLGSTK